MGMKRTIQKLLKSTFLKAPFGCRQYEVSLISSADDETSRPSNRLIDAAMQSVSAARQIDMSKVSTRVTSPPLWPNIWPGEHYRLLAGLIEVMQPKLVIEIGTYTGLSALAMLEKLPARSKLVTFDILPWKTIGHTHLIESDFASGQLQQEIADLADPESFQAYLPLLQQADLIFVDGPKNVTFEEAFLKHMSGCDFPNEPLIVFDDIRLWNMLHIWRGIDRPKLDLTSFGHWSGTGLVDWTRQAESGAIRRAA